MQLINNFQSRNIINPNGGNLLDSLLTNLEDKKAFVNAISYVVEKVKNFNYEEAISTSTKRDILVTANNDNKIKYDKLSEEDASIQAKEYDIVLTCENENSPRNRDNSKVVVILSVK